MPRTITRIAFLGLGDIGGRMARRVAGAGFELAAWNRSAPRASQFAASLPAGTTVRMAPTPADAVRGAQVVISCLPTSADVMSVLDAAQGVAAALSSGTVWVDCTLGDPPTSRRIAAELAERGVAYIDAPVSGGTSGAESGTLTVMCGGDAAVIERVRPVLVSFAGKIVHCGAIGTGLPSRRSTTRCSPCTSGQPPKDWLRSARPAWHLGSHSRSSMPRVGGPTRA